MRSEEGDLEIAGQEERDRWPYPDHACIFSILKSIMDLYVMYHYPHVSRLAIRFRLQVVRTHHIWHHRTGHLAGCSLNVIRHRICFRYVPRRGPVSIAAPDRVQSIHHQLTLAIFDITYLHCYPTSLHFNYSTFLANSTLKDPSPNLSTLFALSLLPRSSRHLQIPGISF